MESALDTDLADPVPMNKAWSDFAAVTLPKLATTNPTIAAAIAGPCRRIFQPLTAASKTNATTCNVEIVDPHIPLRPLYPPRYPRNHDAKKRFDEWLKNELAAGVIERDTTSTHMNPIVTATRTNVETK